MAVDFFSREWWQRIRERLQPWPATGSPVPTAMDGWWTGTDSGTSYGHLYRTQPHVRTVVDFLASQLGQLGLQVFRRISDTDRVRVHNHALARLLRKPNPGTTRYMFVSELVQDWAVFGNAYAVKLRRPNRLELYRVPPPRMRPYGDLIPRAYSWTLPTGESVTLPASEVFHLREYNPDDPVLGLSRLETLRKMLAEEAAAYDYRTWFWSNGAKLSGWIGRPKDAPKWTEPQRKQFGEEWRQFQGPQNAGKTAVLEDGMTFEPITATARDSQLIDARKLTREEVAAAFHVPPAMLGIIESQGYGSLREQHKALYQDTLGPTVSLLEGEIERQLLPEFSDSDDVYCQFNINEKLQGSFEEEQSALSVAVGSPYMTRNEARARLNLPRINDKNFDVPVTRLDIAEGQMAKSAAVPPTPVASSPVLFVESSAPPPPSPPDFAPLAERIERALRVLPAELAARLPGPAAPAVLTRAIRDEATGTITGVEERAADGSLLARRALIRDAQGRIVDLATTLPEAFDESKHPRHGRGTKEGGKFREKDEGSVPVDDHARAGIVRKTIDEANLPAAHTDMLQGIHFHDVSKDPKDIPPAERLQPGAVGLYSHWNQRIILAVNPQYDLQVYGGKTVLHEIGHHVHITKMTRQAANAWAVLSDRGKAARISAYARTNAAEHFAEAYRAYASGSGTRAKLKTLEPDVHAFMESVFQPNSDRLFPVGKRSDEGEHGERKRGEVIRR